MPSHTLLVKTSTWSSDSHGLYDYESVNLYKKSFKATSPHGTSFKICRNGTEISMLQDCEPTPENAKILLRVYSDKGAYYMSVGERKDGDKLWTVVKSLKSTPTLTVGDLIRLGRFKLRVKEIVTSQAQHQEALSASHNQPEHGDDETETVAPDNEETDVEFEMDDLMANTCRICLSEGSETNNPLVSPCNCNGTMKYVHLQCLRSWMEGRLNIRSDGTQSSFFCCSLECELCKTTYPTFVEAAHRQIELFEVPRPQYPYIMLEAVLHAPASPMRGLHIVSLSSKRVMKLGRGHESDVRVTDISVSRSHARICLGRNNSFVLEDSNSKFGTLLAKKQPLKIEGNNLVCVQIGRSIISIQAKRHWNHPFATCLKPIQETHNNPVVVIESGLPPHESGTNEAVVVLGPSEEQAHDLLDMLQGVVDQDPRISPTHARPANIQISHSDSNLVTDYMFPTPRAPQPPPINRQTNSLVQAQTTT
eukprot:Platyproteum_vivax@DN4522_c0_g1_i1.p1